MRFRSRLIVKAVDCGDRLSSASPSLPPAGHVHGIGSIAWNDLDFDTIDDDGRSTTKAGAGIGIMSGRADSVLEVLEVRPCRDVDAMVLG